jgi:hypothetical protein
VYLSFLRPLLGWRRASDAIPRAWGVSPLKKRSIYLSSVFINLLKLAPDEWNALRSQFVTLEQGTGRHRKYLPYAFTEQGVIQRLEGIELKQLQSDNKLELLFRTLERDIVPKQGIFYEGQLFDAFVFASDLIKSAKTSIVLVDNYVDEITLLLLSKRLKGVNCTVHSQIRESIKLDLVKHNKQYPTIELIENRGSHDRFLIIDDQYLYHFGASLKDLGTKCFAFNQMNDLLTDFKSLFLKKEKIE